MTNKEVFQRVVSKVFNDLGMLVTEENFGDGMALVCENVTITPGEIDVPWLGGYRKGEGFLVDIAYPPSGDLAEAGEFRTIDEAVTKAVELLANYKASNVLTDIGYEGMAADFAAEQAAIEAAKREGIEGFDAGLAKEANPYPYGIAHYDAWEKGWDFAAGLRVAKGIR